MSTIFIVLKANFKRALNNKVKFIINLILPIVAIVLAMFANYISNPSINISVVEKESFSEGKRIISLLEETKGINVKVVKGEMLRTNMILGKYDAAIILKKEFKKGEVGNINEYFDFYNIKDKNLNKIMEEMVKSYLVKDEAISMESLSNELQKGMLSKEARIISFLATVLFITCVVNGSVIIRDKSENTFNRFMYSPNRKFQYILGNVIYNYILSYIQLFLALVITNIMGMKLGLSLGTLLTYGFILVLVTTTFGTFIAAIFKKELYANLFAGAISLILSLIGGAFITYDKMPKGLQLISTITPNRWIIKSIDWLEQGTMNSINPIIILMLFSLVFSMTATFANRYRRHNHI